MDKLKRVLVYALRFNHSRGRTSVKCHIEWDHYFRQGNEWSVLSPNAYIRQTRLSSQVCLVSTMLHSCLLIPCFTTIDNTTISYAQQMFGQFPSSFSIPFKNSSASFPFRSSSNLLSSTCLSRSNLSTSSIPNT